MVIGDLHLSMDGSWIDLLFSLLTSYPSSPLFSLFLCPCFILFGQGNEQKCKVVHDSVISLGA
jgi:hypothetical protein